MSRVCLYNRRNDKCLGMQCPKDSAQMQRMQRYEVDIDYCPLCKGVWLDRGEIDKIAKIQRSYEDEHYNKHHYREGGTMTTMMTTIMKREIEDFLAPCLADSLLAKIKSLYFFLT